jgi:hypothetical protein
MKTVYASADVTAIQLLHATNGMNWKRCREEGAREEAWSDSLFGVGIGYSTETFSPIHTADMFGAWEVLLARSDAELRRHAPQSCWLFPVVASCRLLAGEVLTVP